MHEFSLIANLLKQIEKIAQQENATKVLKVYVQLGALAHISADHFREHFVAETGGTIAQEAELEIEVMTDDKHPQAQDIILKSIDVDI